YDSNSNIVACSSYSTTEIQAGNRLLRAGDVRFEYDAEGQLTSKHEAAGTTTYSYDAGGRLVSIHRPGAAVTTYRYDPVGRRVAKREGGVETTYRWAVDNLLCEETGGVRVDFTFLTSSFVPIAMAIGPQSF